MARAPSNPHAAVRAAFLAGQIDRHDYADFISGVATLSGRMLRYKRKDYLGRVYYERKWLGRRFASAHAQKLREVRMSDYNKLSELYAEITA